MGVVDFEVASRVGDETVLNVDARPFLHFFGGYTAEVDTELESRVTLPLSASCTCRYRICLLCM